LLTTLEVINKRSQNFYAESLLKTLGARYCQRGDWAHGLQAVREFLAEAGLGERGFHQADGSGMSRENRFTARQVTTLLRYMYFHRYGREYLRSLAFSGEGENSWRKRLADPPYRGNVFAKTGSLRGVSALSGYAKAASGRVYAFSILGNGVKSDAEAHRAQDALVRTLIDLG
jgi:D-alanyl-D-alanine carboxypeptidase/D-alanyl-D-alanine-endopeptidase (penicillin-binding protein 4)